MELEYMYQEETPKQFLEKVQHTNMYNHINQQTFILNSLVYDGYIVDFTMEKCILTCQKTSLLGEFLLTEMNE